MPGFTADAAVFDRRATYALAQAADAGPAGPVVVPQACVNLGPCRVCLTFRAFPPRVCFSIRCPFGIGFSRCVP
jgi:hypothetical protein